MFFEDGPKRLNVDANHLINSKKNTRAHTAHTPLLSKALFAFFFRARARVQRRRKNVCRRRRRRRRPRCGVRHRRAVEKNAGANNKKADSYGRERWTRERRRLSRWWSSFGKRRRGNANYTGEYALSSRCENSTPLAVLRCLAHGLNLCVFNFTRR